jgi:hypothetical protein
MAPKKKQEQETPPETTPAAQDPDAAAGQFAPPRPAQGIVPRPMATGNPKLDLITRFGRPRIDPSSLVVDGQDPYLALPINEDMANVRIRQVKADHASDLLSCDPKTGGSSIHRLATDAEVEAYLAGLAARARR